MARSMKTEVVFAFTYPTVTRNMPSPTPAKAEFDAYAENYDDALNQGLALTGEEKEYFAEGRVQWLRQRLKQRNYRPSSCLDFGCGTGTSATFLRDGLGISSYIGHDPSAESIQQARQQTSWSEARFTAEVESLSSERVDLAFCNGVFHHIPPEFRVAALQAIWGALKPGGLFAFWENNRWNPVVHYMMNRVPFDQDAQMLFPFQARRLLQGNGFRVLSTDYLFVFPGALRALRPLEPALCKLPLGGQYLMLAQKPESN